MLNDNRLLQNGFNYQFFIGDTMEDNMRKISLQESWDLSLKLEDLLNQEAKINTRKSALARENKVEMDRCLEEQEKIREIIRTGLISYDDTLQNKLFSDDDDSTNFTVSVNFSSMNSGMLICEIPLQDMFNFSITPAKKDALRAEFNNALYAVKNQFLGYTKIHPMTITSGTVNGLDSVEMTTSDGNVLGDSPEVHTESEEQYSETDDESINKVFDEETA